MAQREYKLHNGIKGAALTVRVTPRARKNEVVEIFRDGTIRIRLTAPSTNSETNQALAKYLSKILDVPASNIEIVAGITGHDKLVSVLEMTPEEAHQKIMEQLL